MTDSSADFLINPLSLSPAFPVSAHAVPFHIAVREAHGITWVFKNINDVVPTLLIYAIRPDVASVGFGRVIV